MVPCGLRISESEEIGEKKMKTLAEERKDLVKRLSPLKAVTPSGKFAKGSDDEEFEILVLVFEAGVEMGRGLMTTEIKNANPTR
jgi:hypothetical protein